MENEFSNKAGIGGARKSCASKQRFQDWQISFALSVAKYVIFYTNE